MSGNESYFTTNAPINAKNKRHGNSLSKCNGNCKLVGENCIGCGRSIGDIVLSGLSRSFLREDLLRPDADGAE